MEAGRGQTSPTKFRRLRAYSACALMALISSACGVGDFDQQVRGDIDEIRDSASVGINSNPGKGEGSIQAIASTAGAVASARVEVFGVQNDGSIADQPDEVLGNGITSDFDGTFSVTIREPYSGPLIIRLSRTVINGRETRFDNPATAETQPEVPFGPDDELLGFLIDFPQVENARIVSPFTTLVVERARWLGGLSSGNLSLASHQVGQFFGMRSTKNAQPATLTATSGRRGPLAEDMAFAAVSQLARIAGVPQGRVWQALREDIRDNGALDGSIGLIPESGMDLPDLGQDNYIGTVLLLDGYLAEGNEDNVSGYQFGSSAVDVTAAPQIALLDQARRMDDFPLEMTDASVRDETISMKAGETRGMDLRAFTRIRGDQPYLIASSDGPTRAIINATSSAPGIVSIDAMNRLVADPAANPGESAVISITIRPDGVSTTGSFTGELEIRVTIVAP